VGHTKGKSKHFRVKSRELIQIFRPQDSIKTELAHLDHHILDQSSQSPLNFELCSDSILNQSLD
jgi:hypothetical protein